MFPIRDSRTSGKFPYVNLAIITATIYIFFLEVTSPELNLFIARYGLIPATVDFTEIKTLRPFVTSMFFHARFFRISSPTKVNATTPCRISSSDHSPAKAPPEQDAAWRLLEHRPNSFLRARFVQLF